jgi:hypothetical protein
MGLLPSLDQPPGPGRGFLREEALLLSCLCGRPGADAPPGFAAEAVRRLAAAGADLPPLLLLFAPAETPAAAVPVPAPRTFRARNGYVATLAEVGGRRLRLVFQCGAPQGPELTPVLNRYMQFHNNRGLGGGYTLALDGVGLLAGPGGSYDFRTEMFPLVAVNGGGHIMEHRYGGFRLRPEQIPFIACFQDDERLLYLRADLRPAYRADLPLTRAERHLALLRERGIVAVVDDFRAEAPLVFAHHLQTPGAFEARGNGAWEIRHADAVLHAAALMPEGWVGWTGELPYVPTYSGGLNNYKSRDWQPEVQAQYARPLSYQHLVHEGPGRACAFTAAVLFGLEPLRPSWQASAGEGFRIETGDGPWIAIDAGRGAAMWGGKPEAGR